MSKFASGSVMSWVRPKTSKDFLCGLSWNSGFSQTVYVSHGTGIILMC